MKIDLDTTLQNTLKNILVKKNDTLSNCFNTNTLSISNGPKHGTASVSANASVNYTPSNGYNGKDTFSYKICALISGNNICDSAMVYVTIKSIPTNNILNEIHAAIAIYPNPSNEFIHCSNVSSFESIEIVNIMGQSILKTKIQNNLERIDLSDIGGGIYFLVIKDKMGSVALREQISILH